MFEQFVLELLKVVVDLLLALLELCVNHLTIKHVLAWEDTHTHINSVIKDRVDRTSFIRMYVHELYECVCVETYVGWMPRAIKQVLAWGHTHTHIYTQSDKR